MQVPQRLPSSFTPHAYTVIIGKGKMPQQASGNQRLKVIVQSFMEQYGNSNKSDAKVNKSYLVSRVFYTIQEACHPHPEAAFVRFDGQHWWEASQKSARDKIAGTFRDFLHSQYKSSTKNKVAKRRAISQAKKTPKRKNRLTIHQPETTPATSAESRPLCASSASSLTSSTSMSGQSPPTNVLDVIQMGDTTLSEALSPSPCCDEVITGADPMFHLDDLLRCPLLPIDDDISLLDFDDDTFGVEKSNKMYSVASSDSDTSLVSCTIPTSFPDIKTDIKTEGQLSFPDTLTVISIDSEEEV